MLKNNFHTLDAVVQEIQKHQSFVLVTHTNPDADALGSMLSLTEALKNEVKTCTAIVPGHIPSFLRGMPRLETMTSELPKDVDCMIVTDTADDYRMGGVTIDDIQAKQTICIDHHRSNPGFLQMNYVDANAGSTCEIIYQLLKLWDVELTPVIATWLYTGLLSDTGRFLYESTSVQSHLMAADLITRDIDRNAIHTRLFQSTPYHDFLLNKRIVDNATFHSDKQVVIANFTLDDLKETKGTSDGSDQALNQLRDIDEVEVSILIKQVDAEEYKVSMRSKNYMNVSEIAQTFNGGGHLRAAGFTYYGPYETLYNDLLLAVKKQVKA